jgi:diguanylate cyclase (GGDEF)-like protein
MLEPCVPINEALRLKTLQGLSILDTPVEERFDRLTRIAQRIFDVPIVGISLVDSNRQWFKSRVGIEAPELPRSISFCGHAIHNETAFVIPDACLDDRFADNPMVSGPPNIRFYAGQPLRATNEQLIGTLCILDQLPREFDAEDIRMLRTLTSLVEKELNYPDLKKLTRKLTDSQNSLLEAVAQLEEKEERERSRNKSLEMVSRGYPLQEILESIVTDVELQHPEMMCCVLILDDEGKTLMAGAAPSLPKFYTEALNKLPVAEGTGSCGTAAALGEPVIAEDLQTHPYWKDFRKLTREAGIRSCWSQPIKSAGGDLLGTFSINRSEPSTPTNTDIKLIEQTANLAAIALERNRTDRLIWRQANYDSLTGLPNRNMLRERLEQEISKSKRLNSQIALLFLDLDHFKEVNDTLGHDRGDHLLAIVAQRLRKCVRSIDTVARLGGDEFTVIMGELNDTDSVERVASEILEVISQPFQLDQEVAYLSTSVGITFYPDNGLDLDTLIKNADQAMYEAKNKGRNRFQYFAPAMQDVALQRTALLNDMRKALPNNEFEVYYQPIVDLKSGSIYKAEALIRWLHPQRGMVSPLDFIPVAEETDLIIDIGDWVFQQVLQQAVEWRTGIHQHFQISINTSPVQYRDNGSNLAQWLDRLEQAGLPGQAINIEITESLLMEDRITISDSLIKFRDHGVSVSLDDFGTGYSSLSYLRKFDIDTLKIDQSFVHNLEPGSDDLALCEAIIVMAHKLGLQVIAEGVETSQQRDLLLTAECDFAQGFLFSEPAPAAEFPLSGLKIVG